MVDEAVSELVSEHPAARRERELEVKAAGPMWGSNLARALDGGASPRAAIKARCLQCTGYQRQDVKHCAVHSCALWRYRPFQKSEEGSDEQG